MFKRILLGLTFLCAFGAVSVGVTDNAEAWRRWGRPYYSSYYYGPPRSYYYSNYGSRYPMYRSYYGPRFYNTYRYPAYYAAPDYYYYGPRRGVYVGW